MMNISSHEMEPVIRILFFAVIPITGSLSRLWVILWDSPCLTAFPVRKLNTLLLVMMNISSHEMEPVIRILFFAVKAITGSLSRLWVILWESPCLTAFPVRKLNTLLLVMMNISSHEMEPVIRILFFAVIPITGSLSRLWVILWESPCLTAFPVRKQNTSVIFHTSDPASLNTINYSRTISTTTSTFTHVDPKRTVLKMEPSLYSWTQPLSFSYKWFELYHYS
jgi:hypothetical protein